MVIDSIENVRYLVGILIVPRTDVNIKHNADAKNDELLMLDSKNAHQYNISHY